MDDLDRFVAAQRDSHALALAELRAGAKRSHWMWYVFPQIAGLGHSAMARHYAIRDLAEARAVAPPPLLGARYRDSIAALLTHRGTPAATIMGEVDALKLRSSLTLFARAGVADAADALAAFFPGPDPATLARL
jgi:uncharacterized protein (DUF1810 family)